MTTLRNEQIAAPAFADLSASPLQLHPEDYSLIDSLESSSQPRVLSEATELYFANPTIGQLAKASYTQEDLTELEEHLQERGTITIPFVEGSVTIDGIERELTLVAATDTTMNHGDMSAKLYLRDQVQAARSMMELSLHNPERYEQEGQMASTLLVSALHLMSTPSQLQRIENVIEKGSKGEESGQADWPHILMDFNDLNAVNPNGWRNKQDTLQMLAYATLDALENGILSVDDLAEAHKQFLGSIVPFLAAVGYPKYENCGSWEEVPAVRTSVMAIETALLHKIRALTEDNDTNIYNFLELGYKNSLEAHPSLANSVNTAFKETVQEMENTGLQEISNRLPFESPDTEYDPQVSTQYREADATLVYLLMYDIPQLLAKTEDTDTAAQDQRCEEIETLIVGQLFTLIDNETNGMFRYEGDSYQREKYYTKAVQDRVSWIKEAIRDDAKKRDGEPDLALKQSLRGHYVPEGRAAAWTHPLSQISAWAAKRALSLKTDNLSNLDVSKANRARTYHELSTLFLNFALSTITGNQMYPVLNGDGSYHAKRVPSYQLPESMISYDALVVPSPNTPLNWSAASLAEALGMQINYTLAA